MKKIILAALILLSATSFASAQKVRFPAIIAAKDSNSIVIFKKCSFIDECSTIGTEEGYNFKDLDFSPTGDRLKSLGIAVIEGAVGAAIGFIPAWAIMVGKDAGLAGFYGTMAVSTAGGIIIPSLITDYINPAYYWRKGKIISRFFDRNNYLYDDAVIMEFSSIKKMDKHVKALENILRKEFGEE